MQSFRFSECTFGRGQRLAYSQATGDEPSAGWHGFPNDKFCHLRDLGIDGSKGSWDTQAKGRGYGLEKEQAPGESWAVIL
jgi:hypothetical protein